MPGCHTGGEESKIEKRINIRKVIERGEGRERKKKGGNGVLQILQLVPNAD